MRSINPHGDKKKKEEKMHGISNNMDTFAKPRFADKDANGVAMQFEVKQKNGFWRRLLERVSCFGHNQRYEDKDSRVSIEHIDNGVKCLLGENSKIFTIPIPNNISF